MTRAAIHVLINRRDIVLPETPITAELILCRAGDYGPDYELFVLRDEHDATGGTKLERSEGIGEREEWDALPRHPGQRDVRRDPPSTITTIVQEPPPRGGSATARRAGLPARTADPAARHRDRCSRRSRTPDGIFSRSPHRRAPQDHSSLSAVRNGHVLGKARSAPRIGHGEPVATNLEVHFGRAWRRFSWHRNSPWIPGRDDLLTHMEFARARLENPQ